MADSRLPAHLEIAAIVRLAEAAGGFATVLAKGERDAGTILLVATRNGHLAQLYERMPSLDGGRSWTLSKTQTVENAHEFNEYVDRRRMQDRDVWILEVDIADGAQFVANLPA